MDLTLQNWRHHHPHLDKANSLVCSTFIFAKFEICAKYRGYRVSRPRLALSISISLFDNIEALLDLPEQGKLICERKS